MAPLFSIVTITYENLLGLRDTVRSVRCQTFRDFEHIVVDGGSADGTAEWLRAEFDGAGVEAVRVAGDRVADTELDLVVARQG